MENRDKDKVSRNSSEGDVNREPSKRQENLNDDSTAEFGQDIDRSKNPKEEPNRRDEGIGDEGMKGDRGRSGSVGTGGGVGEEIENESSRNRDIERERGSGGRSGSSESEH